MKKILRPYDSEGIWMATHPFYYYCAYSSYEDFQAVLMKIKMEEQRIRSANHEIEEPDLTSYVEYVADELHKEAFKLSTSAFLFLCMTLESFINHYGTKRLGEQYYKRNLERIGITEKLSLIMAICNQINLDPKDPVLVKLRTLFDQRNSLVHPKTKKFTTERLEEFITKHPAEIEIELQICFGDLEFIIEKLCEFDFRVERSFEFRKPGIA